MNPLYETMATSVFERMSLAAARHGAVNLGQGFPDFGWPDEILDKAAEAVRAGSNQYAPSRGLPQMRQAVADHYRRHQGLALTPDHICVTRGATAALNGATPAPVNRRRRQRWRPTAPAVRALSGRQSKRRNH